MLREIAIFLIILGMIFTATGGILDIMNKDHLPISKEHLWNDGTYLTVFAIALLLIDKK